MGRKDGQPEVTMPLAMAIAGAEVKFKEGQKDNISSSKGPEQNIV